MVVMGTMREEERDKRYRWREVEEEDERVGMRDGERKDGRGGVIIKRDSWE